MVYAKDSPIAAPSDVTGEELYKAFEPMTPAPQLENMRNAMYAVVDLSAATGIDPLVMAAVGWVETGYGPNGLPFRHPNWENEFNFGNLGRTGDEAQDAAAQTWQTPADGAVAAVAHMVGYRYGVKWRTVWDVDELGDPRILDNRFQLAINNTPNKTGVKTIGELNNRWAVDRDNDYGGKLATRANALRTAIDKQRAANGLPVTPAEPEEPMATRDPYDLIRDYVVDAWVEKTGPGFGYSAGNRNIVALAEHETQGEGSGPWYEAFFECPNGERCEDALVDYLIPKNEKKIYVFQNPFTSNRIPYASGGSAASITQLAAKASRRMGNPYGGVNMFTAALEVVKKRGAPMTADQIELTARLLAYIWAMNDYPVNDAMYPDSLGNEVKTSVNHSDYYTSTNCRINDDDRAKFEAMALVFLAAFYDGTLTPGTPTTPTKPTYAPAAVVSALVPFMTADPGGVPAIVQAAGSEWIFVNDRVTVARATTPRLQRADPNALPVGPELKKGEVFTAKFMVKATSGEWFYLTAMFTRVQVRHTARLSDTV